VGFQSSNDALALVPALDRLQIPTVVASATNPKILHQKKYVVQTCLNDESMARALADQLYSLGKRKVIIATDVTETFTVGLSAYFQKYFEKRGGSIRWSEEIDIDHISFKSIAKRIQEHSQDADVLLISARALESVYLWLALQEVHFKLNIIGTDGFQSQNMDLLIHRFKSRFNLTLFPSHWNPFSTEPQAVRFFKEFRSEFPLDPLSDHEIDPFLSYDSAVILFQAIQKTKSLNPDLLIQNLKATQSIGISGTIGFHPDGSSTKIPYFLKFEKGALKRVE
jgi:branched-chain amino acid transport system substrate-binding protein